MRDNPVFYGIDETSDENCDAVLKRYLSDRKQYYVEFNNTQSATQIITPGVPQGSILCRLLFFILYI